LEFNFFPKFLRDRQIEGKCDRIEQELGQWDQKGKKKHHNFDFNFDGVFGPKK